MVTVMPNYHSAFPPIENYNHSYTIFYGTTAHIFSLMHPCRYGKDNQISFANPLVHAYLSRDEFMHVLVRARHLIAQGNDVKIERNRHLSSCDVDHGKEKQASLIMETLARLGELPTRGIRAS